MPPTSTHKSIWSHSRAWFNICARRARWALKTCPVPQDIVWWGPALWRACAAPGPMTRTNACGYYKSRRFHRQQFCVCDTCVYTFARDCVYASVAWLRKFVHRTQMYIPAHSLSRLAANNNHLPNIAQRHTSAQTLCTRNREDDDCVALFRLESASLSLSISIYLPCVHHFFNSMHKFRCKPLFSGRDFWSVGWRCRSNAITGYPNARMSTRTLDARHCNRTYHMYTYNVHCRDTRHMHSCTVW